MLNREHHLTIRTRIGRIVIMGGALDVPGNTTSVAECKVFFLVFGIILSDIHS